MNDGGPAFPSDSNLHKWAWPGMTLRDWFAGMALCGLAANMGIFTTFDSTADTAYELVDAMFKEREKREQ